MRLVKKALLLVLLFVGCATSSPPLASWRPGEVRSVILRFVEEVSDPNSGSYVPPEDRIAVFDNDGTLWIEKPLYPQVAFAMDLLRERARENPLLAKREPYRSLLSGEELPLLPRESFFEELLYAHADLSTEGLEERAYTWLTTEPHLELGVPHKLLVYQPMVELIQFLQQHQFKVFLCTGGGIEFVRSISAEFYNVPRENVIGSSLAYAFDPATATVDRLPEQLPINDRARKVENIQLHIGRRPILVAGNSDGDYEMLLFSEGSEGPSLQLLLHHDDGEREYAYDLRAEKVLEEAKARGWTIISMREDFVEVFPSLPSR